MPGTVCPVQRGALPLRASLHERSVEVDCGLCDRIPTELRQHPAASVPAELLPQPGVAGKTVDRGSQAGGEGGRISRIEGAGLEPRIDQKTFSPGTTTSGMPPTAEATTAVSQAMASRLMMPNGWYTEGQQNTAAWV